jgi:hypothetical protein
MRNLRALTLLLFLGCTGATEPEGVPELEFEYGPEDSPQQPPAAVITTEDQTIVVTGHFVASNTCYDIKAKLEAPDSASYRLTVYAQDQQGPYVVCWDVSMSVPYLAKFKVPALGPYEIEVMHRMGSAIQLRVGKVIDLRPGGQHRSRGGFQ